MVQSPWGFRHMLDATAEEFLDRNDIKFPEVERIPQETYRDYREREREARRAFLEKVSYDLSVGPGPRLHVPQLAGVAQGPGFPNLSCLVRMASRVLSSYCWGGKPE
jgi:hypothetical protein